MNDRLNYSTHADLLDQGAASEAEAREVRRILGPETQRKLTEADIDAQIAFKGEPWPICCGACAQGRKLCPTPQACQISVDKDAKHDTARLIWIAAGLLLTWAVIAAAAIAAFS